MDKYENYDLTEEQWKRIQPLLPPENTGKRGRPRKDDRIMLNGMLWMNRSGAQWRQLPKCYGPWQSVYSRFAKWLKDGVWEAIFSELSKNADTENSCLIKLFYQEIVLSTFQTAKSRISKRKRRSFDTSKFK